MLTDVITSRVGECRSSPVLSFYNPHIELAVAEIIWLELFMIN
jgi:hypothetical protein